MKCQNPLKTKEKAAIPYKQRIAALAEWEGFEPSDGF